MLNSDAAVTRELLHSSDSVGGLDDASAIPNSSGVRASAVGIGVPERLRKLSHVKLTDKQLALVASAILFCVGAWPLMLTEVPPYQDLPNHLATLTVIQNLQSYPEYVFNGFFKTNAALFTWLYFVGKVTGVQMAARLFAVLTLGLTAYILPRIVLHFTGSRRRMIVASMFSYPMVHHWFVSMGMLDFAIAIPLSLILLVALDRHRTAPSLKGALSIAALGLATWYAHVFPLLVVHLLIVIEALTRSSWKERIKTARVMTVPLLPAAALALMSVAQHVKDSVGPAPYVYKKLLAPWELVYNLWAEWFWGYTHLTLVTLIPCIALAFVSIRALLSGKSKSNTPAFFSGWAILVLTLLYCFTPFKMTNWFHVNSRLIPYFWVALLMFVPERLPKSLIAALGLSGLFYSGAMGVDYVRLDRERQEFAAGVEAVPEGARLLPLLFEHKGGSVNTRNLLHAWGYYVSERQTAAPLLFAHSHSFPVTYKEPPPMRFHHLVLEGFAPDMRSPESLCRSARVEDCDALYKSVWQKFYADATPRYDHLLLWDATPEATAMVPKDYERTFSRGRLMIYARRGAAKP